MSLTGLDFIFLQGACDLILGVESDQQAPILICLFGPACQFLLADVVAPNRNCHGALPHRRR